jgi:hypothetical protein
MKIQIVNGECLFSRDEARKKQIECEIIELWNKEKNKIEEVLGWPRRGSKLDC